MTHQIIQPDGWVQAKGYANGVLTEDGTLYTGGQIGWNKDQVFVAKDFIGQMEQVLRNILDIVEAAGGTAADVVRMTWFVKDKKEYMAHQREVGEAYRRVFGRHFPAMSMLVVADLIEDEALVEIEATAKITKA
ncbi:RidA family protein [Roseibium aggregatum]|uniref:RidA family protein n=1 Tax=Roseibium aggregatum TaxID=187304 RepID=A0A926NQE0_9HYPH|nr:RidA family protein [Roseibium aggregatum]MBD1545442.1 RidA family protein [Roseibium aggregatum]